MKRSARRRTRTAAADRPQPAEYAPQGRRATGFLLGAAVALIVATPLISSEAAVPFGSHVVLVMAWLILGAAWLVRCALDEKPVWHIGLTGALVGVFLALHSTSAVVMLGQGHGRPTLNALWTWISMGVAFLTVRQLVRSGVEQRALISVLLAVACGMSCFGIYQTAVVYPQQRRAYEANPEKVIGQAGVYAPPGSPERRHFEDRLKSTEPTGPFALTNSLAGVLAPSLVLLIGLFVPLLRTPGALLGTGRLQALAGAALVAIALLTCLLLTKSRTGFLAALAGVGVLVLFGTVSRFWLWWRWIASGIVGLSAVAVLMATLGGLDRQVVTEAPRSLLYRLQYWQASTAMIAEHPWWGCGPGNFKDYYTHYKLPEASETIADPHNLMVEVAATAGLPALMLFVVVLVVLLGRVARPPDRSGQDRERERELAAAAAPLYIGAFVGLLLAYAAGWSSGHMPSLDLLAFLLPALALTTWLLNQWVACGRLATVPLIAALVTMLVNLLAAGGIGLPGVAGLLWVLAALAMNVAERAEYEQAGHEQAGHEQAGRSWLWGPVAYRSVIGLAAAVALALVALNYFTMYRPVLASQAFAALKRETAVRPLAPDQIAARSQLAAAADPWWSEPCEWGTHAALQQWLAEPTDANLALFDQASAAVQQRNPQASHVARRQGDWLLTMYDLASQMNGGRRAEELLRRADAAYTLAISLYPNSSPLHAQLAWVCVLEGDTKRAVREADAALRLDQRMPHEELKLKSQRISGLESVQVGGGDAPLVGGGDPEQLMRDIRKTLGQR